MSKKPITKKDPERSSDVCVQINLDGESAQKLREFSEMFGGKQRATLSRLIAWFVRLPPEEQFKILVSHAKALKDAEGE